MGLLVCYETCCLTKTRRSSPFITLFPLQIFANLCQYAANVEKMELQSFHLIGNGIEIMAWISMLTRQVIKKQSSNYFLLSSSSIRLLIMWRVWCKKSVSIPVWPKNQPQCQNFLSTNVIGVFPSKYILEMSTCAIIWSIEMQLHVYKHSTLRNKSPKLHKASRRQTCSLCMFFFNHIDILSSYFLQA